MIENTRRSFPEPYSEATAILASSSRYVVDRFRQLYTNTIVKNVGPQHEPKKGASRRAATAKNNEISNTYDEPFQITDVIYSVDVVYVWKGKKQHRPDRDGEPGRKDLKKIADEAVHRYSSEFEATWKITFAINIPHERKRRLATVHINAHFPKGIPDESVIRSSILPSSNSLLPLIELAEANDAKLSIRNRDREEVVPLSASDAIMLIRDKLLPYGGIHDLLLSEEIGEYIDHDDRVWGIVAINLHTLFSGTAGSRQ